MAATAPTAAGAAVIRGCSPARAIAAVGCALLFNLHELPLGIGPALVAGLVMLVFFTGYTSFYIPHMCLASEMTRSYDERTSVMVYRTFLITVAGIGVTAGIPALVAYWGGASRATAASAWWRRRGVRSP